MNKKRNIQAAGLSFLAIISLFIIIQAISGLYPFGTKSNLLWDEEIQYVDYFAFYRDVLLGKASIGYSFSKSAGGSLMALFGYYLGCPLNLFVVFFENEQIPMFLFLLTAVKLGLAGVTMHIFLRKRLPELSFEIGIMISVAYGLMQYNILQLSNIMWLDGVIMLPILMLSVYEFVERNKKQALFISLLFSIAINWYTGYMIGLFAVFYFLYERLLKVQAWNRKEFQSFFLDSIRCAFLMLCGLLGSCFLFYPIFKGLQKGKKAFDLSIFHYDTYDSFFDIFRGFAVGSIVPTVSLYCGLLFMGCFFYYFLCKRVEIKEKILTFIFAIFMFISCWIKPLDYIWSGLRVAGTYRFRYSFLVIFLILFIAAKGALLYEKKKDNKKMAIIFLACILIFVLHHYQTPYEKRNFAVTIFSLLLYTLLFLFIKKSQYVRRIFPVLLAAELVLNGILVFGVNYSWNPDITVYKDYVKGSEQQLQQIQDRESSNFYRIDTLEKRNDLGDGCSSYLNEAMAYGYRGLAHYSSTFDTDISRMIFDLGYSTLLDLSVIQESILPADSLFGVKYILSKSPVLGYEKMEDIPEYNEKAVYYNPYALGLGMETDSKIIEHIDTVDPFEFQNQLYSNLLGYEVQIFRKKEAELGLEDNRANIYISSDDSEDILYGYVDTWISELKLYVDGNYRCNYATWLSYKVFAVGYGNQEHVISLENYTGTKQELFPYFYYLDQDVFEDVIQELKEKEMKVELFEDGYVKGSYEADSETNLLLSIPYDDGWEAEVNGKRVTILGGANALSVIPLEKGKNEIELKYKIPGFQKGIVLSVLGFGLFFVFCKWESRKRRK